MTAVMGICVDTQEVIDDSRDGYMGRHTGSY